MSPSEPPHCSSSGRPARSLTADSGGVIADPRNPPAEALDAIAAVDADVLCVALGNPKQERFIAASRERLRTPVMIGIGGSLDLLVGVRRRAPQVVQRLALEWVYRAIQEPARLGPRYAKDIVVLGPTMAKHIVTARLLDPQDRCGTAVDAGDRRARRCPPAGCTSSMNRSSSGPPSRWPRSSPRCVSAT